MPRLIYNETNEQHLKEIVLVAIKKHKTQKQQAAALKMSTATLWRIKNKYNL